MAAFSLGTEIIQLRHICRRLDLSLRLEAALEAVARGNCVVATEKLAELDALLASRPGAAELRARGLILALSASLTQHGAFFEAGAPG
jgi:hypothetical protein